MRCDLTRMHSAPGFAVRCRQPKVQAIHPTCCTSGALCLLGLLISSCTFARGHFATRAYHSATTPSLHGCCRESSSAPVSPMPAASLGQPADSSGATGSGAVKSPQQRGSMGAGPSLPQCEQAQVQPASQPVGRPAGEGIQPSSGHIASPASAASAAAGAAGQGGGPKAQQAPGSPADVDDLMSLLLGNSLCTEGDSPTRGTSLGSSARGSGGGGRGSRSTSTAASPAPPGGMPWPASPPPPLQQQQQQQQPSSDWQLAAALQQEEVAASLAAARGSGRAAAASQDDWRLAAELQQEEDAAAAAAEAAAAESSAADAALAAAEAEAARDEQLARQWQEEEDACVAAALAAEEDAAASAAATAATMASSANFWSALHLHDPEGAAPGAGAAVLSAAASQRRQGGAAAAAGGGSRGGSGAELDATAGSAFPSLQAAAGSSRGSGSGGPGSDALRQALLRDHRSTAQRALERGSGVQLLRRAEPGGSPAGRPPLHPGYSAGGSWLGSPASEGGGGLGGGTPGGLPPLRLDDGGQLLEDDLDYQLLLRVSEDLQQCCFPGCMAA